MKFDELYDYQPYEFSVSDKEHFLLSYFNELDEYHYRSCNEYHNIIDVLFGGYKEVDTISEIPFLPVRLFKELDLQSVPRNEIIKTMTSSGTTGSRPSRIHLDKETAARQQKVMIKILADFIGTKRLPMIIIDSKNVLRDRKMLAVRGAAILGFSMAGADRLFALKEDMSFDLENVKVFLDKHKGEQILIFGFTSMIWQFFYKAFHDGEINFDKAILIHGGGWKKLEDEKVDNDRFKDCLKERFGISRVHDYYGMVEQTGCIYMECECGHIHVSNYSDVIIRRKDDFSVADIGEEGLIQVVSTIPLSYPGHSILTEDRGMILGQDDCPCGRRGKYIKLLGRVKKAEVRGCSDAY